jgi:chromosome segregation ATPase
VYPGTYADYQRAKASIAPGLAEPPAPTQTVRQRVDGDPAARRRLAADLREAERAVTAAEERLRAVEAALSDPASYAGDLAELSRDHAALQSEVEALTARWAELAEAAEGAA